MIFFIYIYIERKLFWNKWKGTKNIKKKGKKNKRLFPSLNLVSECFLFQLLYFRCDLDYFVDVLILLLRLIFHLYCECSKAKIGQ